MDSKDTIDEYYRVFKAQVNMIWVHGGNPGYHGAPYQEHYDTYVKSKW
jgi:hypothetical protein